MIAEHRGSDTRKETMSKHDQPPPALDVSAGAAEVTKVRIARCTYNGAWWASHVGRIITVLFTDQYGHWTRDTEKPGADGMDGYRFLQWVKPEDCEPLSEEPNNHDEPRA